MMSRSRCVALAPSTAAASRMSVRSDLKSRKQDESHQRRPLPGVDGDKSSERALRVGKQAARTGQAELGQRIAEHAIFRTEQRLEHEPDHQRRDSRRNEQKPERDAVEPVVAPQEERYAEAENEFNSDRAEGECEGVDQCAARGRVPPQVEIIVEPDEMARSRADQVVIVERIEKPLDHRSDGNRQHVNEGRRRERGQKHLALAGVAETIQTRHCERSEAIQES